MKSIVEKEPAKTCYLCGKKEKLERHHIFGGPNRRMSEKYGLTVHLCIRDHRDSKEGVHFNAQKMRFLHKEGQRAFEKTRTREEFRKIFGINYLDGTEGDRKTERQQETGFFFLGEDADG